MAIMLVWLFLLLVIGDKNIESTIIVAELSGNVTDARLFAQQHNLELLPEETKHLPASMNLWAFRVEHNHRAREASKRLSDSLDVVWHEVQEKRRRYTRSVGPGAKRHTVDKRRSAPLLGRDTQGQGASDPLYASQWHLHGNANSLNVESAWGAPQHITGAGVVVAIVDDGIQVAHPDLAVNREYSRDFNSNRGTDCSPYTTDGHGTSAAGVCCALRNNGQCGSGVAPDATLVGIRLIAEPTTDLEESIALSHRHKDAIDIYSNSWGPADDASGLQGPGRLTQMIFQQNVQDGRGGKGSIYVWAGGNGREASGKKCSFVGRSAELSHPLCAR